MVSEQRDRKQFNCFKLALSFRTKIWKLILMRLDSTNYIFLHFHISLLLKSHKLYNCVNVTIVQPVKILQIEGQYVSLSFSLNSEFEKWHERDQALISFINATLTKKSMSYVIGFQTSRELKCDSTRHLKAMRPNSMRSNLCAVPLFNVLHEA